jgi:hypothetical protein
VTWANYARIEEGMTRQQVETLLGGPGQPLGSEQPDRKQLWRGGGLLILVWFDEHDRVTDRYAREEGRGAGKGLTSAAVVTRVRYGWPAPSESGGRAGQLGEPEHSAAGATG